MSTRIILISLLSIWLQGAALGDEEKVEAVNKEFVEACKAARAKPRSESAKTLQAMSALLSYWDEPSRTRKRITPEYPCEKLYLLIKENREWKLIGKQIQDIGFLKFATGSRKLWLTSNNIKDVSPLAQLKKVYLLNLSNNPIESIESIKDLIKQTRGLDLSLNNTKVNELPDGSGWNLSGLSFGGKQSPELDLSELAGMSIRALYLTDRKLNLSTLNKISEIKGLSKLGLSGTNIESLEALKELPLTHLSANNIALTAIPEKHNWSKLQYLTLRDTPQLKSISGLKSCEKLEHLYLSMSEKPAKKLPNLDISALPDSVKFVRLDHRPLSGVKVLESLTNIRDLNLTNTGLTAIPKVIPKMGALGAHLTLRLGYNSGIKSLKGLASHPKLSLYLYLNHTGLKQDDLKSLETNETEFNTLDLSGLGLEEVPKLNPKLKRVSLMLSDNKIKSIDSVRTHKLGFMLDLSKNNITDLSPIVENFKARRLKEVYVGPIHLNISYNPIKSLKSLEEASVSTLAFRIDATKESEALKDFASLNNILGVKILDLSGHRALDFKQMEKMVHLKHRLSRFKCDTCNIKDVQFLKHFSALGTLELDNNKIESLAPLANRRTLHTIFLRNNPLGTTIKATEENCPIKDVSSSGVRNFCQSIRK